MHGGDEISAIVVDFGSHTLKAGFAGEDSPKAVIPSEYGKVIVSGEVAKSDGKSEEKTITNQTKYYLGSNNLWQPKEGLEVFQSPLERGLVTDWDAFEELLRFAYKEALHVNGQEHPLLFAECPFNTKPIREKMTEILFEKFQVPALFLSKTPVLSCFASGKSSGLVIDVGGGITTVTPVHDGYALQKCLSKSTLAGIRLTEEYSNILKERKLDIIPHYKLKGKKLLSNPPIATPSFHKYRVNLIVNDMKESHCRVADSNFEDWLSKNMNIPSIPYELPDDSIAELGTDRFRIPEMIFNPDMLGDKKEDDMLGIVQMSLNSVSKCDPDIRRELFNSIVLTGGSSLFPQFPERLKKDLDEKVPQSYKVKIFPSTSPVERKFSSWIGGSILASLGTFHQMWMSSQEYEEHGKSMVEKKCP